jgi:signal peptidase I
MTKTTRMASEKPGEAQLQPPQTADRVEETPFEAIASICSVLVIGLYILTFLAQNFVIPSGSMENTLLVGDHLVVDRINLAPSEHWFPLMKYREPQRGDVTVFIKPVAEPDLDADGKPQYLFLVKRLIGVPGDHIQLRNGIVIINGVAQAQPYAQPTTPDNFNNFLDNFPSEAPPAIPQVPDSWLDIEFPQDVVNGELVVPKGMYFMMGDNRHNSLDSRYWGFVPRANIVGRPLFNYWSFETPETQYDQTGVANQIAWMAHVALHFFTGTRWGRTFHVIH